MSATAIDQGEVPWLDAKKCITAGILAEGRERCVQCSLCLIG